ncbi:MAG: hypothetical protein B7Z55_03475 [Planctomycetales bacterium 12-60-4]|nr:MAG: hypothetical protein B7Z55_03475 [Planctomycetales bacterium 12-60-4]
MASPLAMASGDDIAGGICQDRDHNRSCGRRTQGLSLVSTPVRRRVDRPLWLPFRHLRLIVSQISVTPVLQPNQ